MSSDWSVTEVENVFIKAVIGGTSALISKLERMGLPSIVTSNILFPDPPGPPPVAPQ